MVQQVRQWRPVRDTVGVMAIVLTVAAVAGLSAQAPGRPAATLPPGTGVEVLRARCLGCHESDLIVSQRLSQAGWGREIDKMVRWGATVPDAERAPLVAYLSTHFAPTAAVSHARPIEGEAVFKRACLACHGADLTEQQRLTPAGWTREVEKRVRWGAAVADADKGALVDFLSSRYPVR
jgi:mono/diheme cytochrome c family protein